MLRVETRLLDWSYNTGLVRHPRLWAEKHEASGKKGAATPKNVSSPASPLEVTRTQDE